jgi:hypothetical protein
MECGHENYNNDTDEWLMRSESIKWILKGMCHEISEDDMMVHILHNVPS